MPRAYSKANEIPNESHFEVANQIMIEEIQLVSMNKICYGGSTDEKCEFKFRHARSSWLLVLVLSDFNFGISVW